MLTFLNEIIVKEILQTQIRPFEGFTKRLYSELFFLHPALEIGEKRLPQIVHVKITFDHTFIQCIDGKELEKMEKRRKSFNLRLEDLCPNHLWLG